MPLPYTYVNGNPVNFADPNGHDPAGPCSKYDNRRCGAGTKYGPSRAEVKATYAKADGQVSRNTNTKSINDGWQLARKFGHVGGELVKAFVFDYSKCTGGDARACAGEVALTGVSYATGALVGRALIAGVKAYKVSKAAGQTGKLDDAAEGILNEIDEIKAEQAGGVAGGAGTALNKAGRAYPDVVDPRTGTSIHFPGEGLEKVPGSARVPWSGKERGTFIKEWLDRGFSTPEGGWRDYDIHHIRPREYGGSNDFDNLVPIPREVHQQQFNTWWRDY